MQERKGHISLQIPLVRLIAIFEEEAKAICGSEEEAHALAAEAVSEFLNNYGRNIIVE